MDEISGELRAYHAIFSPLFQCRERQARAETYLHGLLLAMPRTFVNPMVLHLRGADRNPIRAVPQFVGDGGQDDRPILQHLWREVALDLGDADAVLVVDGSDFPGKGKSRSGSSASTAANWARPPTVRPAFFWPAPVCMATRCLTGGCTCHRTGLGTPMPRAACSVPDDVTFTTRPMLAVAMLQDVVAAGILLCQWVAGDASFGECPALLDGIAALGKWYCAEVAHTTRAWRERPATAMPARAGHGRKPIRAHVVPDAALALTMADLAAGLDIAAWQRHTLKEGGQVPLVGDFAFVRVVAVRDGLLGPDV